MPKQQTETGHFYVSVKDGPKIGLLLGPFATPEACRRWAYSDPIDGGELSLHNQLREAMDQVDPFSCFYGVGMLEMKKSYTAPGCLNRRIGFNELQNGEFLQ